ncbi:MAG: hypothetical protein JXR38_05945, partial [Bacilli bacterium]|nr:hypothetical protein [Bacilli bacterium]
IKSTYPGITIYTTNYPKPKPLRSGKELCLHGAIAMEPHFQTNAINDDRFKNYILRLGDTYNHEIVYRLEENV